MFRVTCELKCQQAVFFFSGAIFGQRNWEIFVFLDMMGMMLFKCKCLDSKLLLGLSMPVYLI